MTDLEKKKLDIKFNELCKKATQEARNKTLAAGKPVCIAKNGKIYNMYNDGRLEYLQDVK